MRIFSPNDAGKVRYTGPGGYRVEKVVAELITRRNVDSVGWFHIIIPKGELSKEHHHESLTELFYFLTPADLKLNGKMTSVQVRTLILLEAGDRHEVYAKDNDVEFLAVKLPNREDDKVLTYE